MATDLPAPPLSADVDLRDFTFMPLDVLRLRDSDLAANETPECCWAAVLLWAASWHQVPAGSIPNDDRWIAKQAGYAQRGKVAREWADIRVGALHGFVECSDGRLYHRVVVEKATEAWQGKLKQRHATECARIKKHNQRHSMSLACPSFAQWMSSGCPWGQNLPVPEDKQGHGRDKSGTGQTVPREMPSKGQGQGQGESHSSESAAPHDPGGGAGPPKDLARAKRLEPAADGGTTEFRRTQTACVEALGGYLDTGGIAPADAAFGPMMALVDQGLALPAVLTALRSIRARPPRAPIKTWGLFATKVAEQISANPKLAEASPPMPSGGTTHLGSLDVPTENVRKTAARWAETGYWPERWGPEPGRPGCSVPEALLGPTTTLAGVERLDIAIRRVVVLWAAKRLAWPEGWGPPPDDPDCAVPSRLRPELEPA